MIFYWVPVCFFKGNGLVSKLACLWVDLLDFPRVQPNLTLQHIVQPHKENSNEHHKFLECFLAGGR